MMYALIPTLSTLFACKEPDIETPVHLQTKELSDATTLRPLFNNTSGNLMAEVVNDSGFAISNESVTFTVNEEVFEVQTDSYGVAVLNVDGDINFGSATWTGQTTDVQGVLIDSLPAIVGYEAGYIPSDNTSFASVGATDGALYAYDHELWWLSERRGAIAQAVGSLGSPVLGLDSGHIDRDGILDAVAFTATDVYLLRGRPYGGFTVLKQFAAPQAASQDAVGRSSAE